MAISARRRAPIVRSARKREELNRAIHEVRRPLQGLLLMRERNGSPRQAAAASKLVELAAAALTDLDAAINGGPTVTPRERVECRELVLSAVERWRATAPAGAVRLRWDAGPATVVGEPVRLVQALDNLLANAFEHGSPPVLVSGRLRSGRLRLVVSNGGGTDSHHPGADPRRGHGLRLIDRVARAHGGRFVFTGGPHGAVAAFEIPAVPSEVAADSAKSEGAPAGLAPATEARPGGAPAG